MGFRRLPAYYVFLGAPEYAIRIPDPILHRVVHFGVSNIGGWSKMGGRQPKIGV